MLPEIRSYGHYRNDNYGVHCLCVTVGEVDIFFSYKTVVAFRALGRLCVSENVWSTTTGKHLTWIDGGDKKARLPRPEFERLWDEVGLPAISRSQAISKS